MLDSNIKFNRAYSLQIEGANKKFVNVELPFTIEFNIIRKDLSGTNEGTIRVYNLSPDKRALIKKDISDYDTARFINLSAGYLNRKANILTGFINQAYSVREGVDYVTHLNCYDGGYAYSSAFVSVPPYSAGTTKRNIALDMIKRLKPYGVELGAVGVIDGVIARGESFIGNPIHYLRDNFGGNFFIDSNKAYILGDDEGFSLNNIVIGPESGLIGTPIREELMVKVELLFEPSVQIGQIITLAASSDKSFNGKYKIIAIEHSGIISEAVNGEARTNLTLQSSLTKFTEVVI